MTPGDDTLFGEALDRPPAERRAFLERACADDADRRARVEALLAGYDQAGTFLERPAVAAAGPVLDAQPGDVIGRYTLVRKIGEGGGGTVYLAEQTVPLRRRVALKILKLGMDTRHVIARFEGERQALALMDHPDIARVLDAGATDTGRPYFVMDFVEGVPINRYCDAHRLTLAARLALFARVCVALQHAHRKGIIHRDVKPSNILVGERDGQPAPKVIDFGIAKATQERLTEQTLLTGLDQFVGTPAYMSPEQADLREGDIDTRSDIYALGVVLYELLTGQLPFEPAALRQAGVEKIRRVICELEPPRPSGRFAALAAADQAAAASARSTNPAALAAALRDDLDWIAMRCLEKDRRRRYGSAQELADDITRHLRHEPVAARPPSAAYRARRFFARHRAACIGAAALALSLVAGTFISVRQAVRATRAERTATAERDNATAATRSAIQARADAQRRQEQAEDLLTFMLGSFRTELKNTRLEALATVDDKAMAYFGALDPRDLSDTVLTRQARALYQIGEARMDEARYAEATTAFTAAYERATALVERHPANSDMRFERAQAEYWLGFVARRRGDFAGARVWLTQYRDSAIALNALDGPKLRAQRELAYGHHNLAVLDVDTGSLADARRGFAAERSAIEAMLADHPEDVALRFGLADIASWLGTVAEADGRYADAMGHFAENSSRLEELVERQPNVPRWRLRLADACGLTADLLTISGRPAEARPVYARARTLRQALVAQDPQNRQWQYAALHGRLREFPARLAMPGDATLAADLREIRAGLESLTKAEPSSSVFAAALAMACRLDARLAFSAGDPGAAAAAAHAVLLSEPLVAGPRPDARALGEFAQACLLSGRIAAGGGDVAKARADWLRAWETLAPHLGTTNDWRLLEPAAQALALLGRTAEARPLADRLRSFGYRAPDPLATSTLDAVVSSVRSTSTHPTL